MLCFLAEGAPCWSIALVLGCLPSLTRPFSSRLHHCHGLILAACIAWMAWHGKLCCFFPPAMLTWQKTWKVLYLLINSIERQVLSTEGRARVPAKTCCSVFKLPHVSGAFADNVCPVAPSGIPVCSHPLKVISPFSGSSQLVKVKWWLMRFFFFLEKR